MQPDTTIVSKIPKTERLGIENMLYVYAGEHDPAKNLPEANDVLPPDRRRIFIHDICSGERKSYTAAHVNTLLVSPDNPDDIKERIVELIPHLSHPQKIALATGLSKDALDAIRKINPLQRLLLESMARQYGSQEIFPLTQAL